MLACLVEPETNTELGTHLSIVDLTRAEQSGERVVAGDDESGNVDEKCAADVEEDEEEVQSRQTQDNVDLGDGGLLLEVVQGGVFGQLFRAPMD
jgi:hypothetical protein